MGTKIILSIIMAVLLIFISSSLFGKDLLKKGNELINIDFETILPLDETDFKRVISSSLPSGLNKKLTQALILVESGGNLNAVRFEKRIWTGENSVGNCNEIGSGIKTVPNSFQKAERINKERAYCSSSFGKYQILGSHIKRLGEYDSYLEIEKKYLNNEKEQDRIFILFIENNEKLNSIFKKKFGIQKEDFPIVAKYYNGAGFCSISSKEKYDEKLAHAYGKKDYKTIC